MISYTQQTPKNEVSRKGSANKPLRPTRIESEIDDSIFEQKKLKVHKLQERVSSVERRLRNLQSYQMIRNNAESVNTRSNKVTKPKYNDDILNSSICSNNQQFSSSKKIKENKNRVNKSYKRSPEKQEHDEYINKFFDSSAKRDHLLSKYQLTEKNNTTLTPTNNKRIKNKSNNKTIICNQNTSIDRQNSQTSNQAEKKQYQIDIDQGSNSIRDGLNSLLLEIFDRVKEFKILRRQDEDIQLQLAKMKWSYCESHFDLCFDFYRCNDNSILKYLCFLLYKEIGSQHNLYKNKIQELRKVIEEKARETFNNQENHDLNYQNNPEMRYLKKIIGETQLIIEDVVLQLQKNQNQERLTHLSQMEYLSNRMKKLQKSLNQPQKNYQDKNSSSDKFYERDSDYSSNQYDGLKKHISDIEKEFKDLDLTKNEIIQEKETLRSKLEEQKELNKSLQDQFKKYIQDQEKQQSSLLQQNQLVRTLNQKIQEQQNEINEKQKKLIDCLKEKDKLISELNMLQKEYTQLTQRIQDINNTFDEVVNTNILLKAEKDELKQNLSDTYREKNELGQLFKEQIEQLTISNKITIEKIAEVHQQAIQDINSQIQQKNSTINEQQKQLQILHKEKLKLSDEINQLKHQSNLKIQQDQQTIKLVNERNHENSKIIQLLFEEACYLGQVALFATDILLRHPSDSIPTTILMLQKDLAQKKPTILQKIQILKQLKIQDKLITGQEVDFHDSETLCETQNIQDINLLDNSHRSFSELLDKGNTPQRGVDQQGIIMRLQQENYSLKIQLNQKELINQNPFMQDDVLSTLIIQCNTIEKLIGE